MDLRLQAFAEALEGLEYLANVDLNALATDLDPRLIDGLKNGQAQKFEYTLELGWKAIKEFLIRQEGVNEASPKKVVKAYHLGGYLGEDDYLELMQAIDDRNRLSHVYRKKEFDIIVCRLPGYAKLLRKILDTMRQAAAGQV